LVAQLVEQYTFNVWALGSSPSQFTKLVTTVTGFFVSRTCRMLAFENGREAKKPTKREAVR